MLGLVLKQAAFRMERKPVDAVTDQPAAHRAEQLRGRLLLVLQTLILGATCAILLLQR